MITDFGKALRKLRIDAGQVLGDMAERLGISVAYLSAIENARREIPDGFVEKIAKLYKLDSKSREELEMLALKQAGQVIVRFPKKGVTYEQITAAMSFANAFEMLDVADLKKIATIAARRQKAARM